ncbi:hypothetical protein HCR13_03150, partial [Wolbachia pipientis]|nr:hypothetical protein [Wolbachia pipientis]
INDMLTEERSKLDELITKVGNENSGLVQSLNNLQTKVEELENNTINEPDWG